MAIDKLGAGSIAAVAARASVLTHKLAAENDELRAKIASIEEENARFKRIEEARKLASEMQAKGLQADMTFEEKVASIIQYEDLAPLREAIKMASSSAGLGLRVADETHADNGNAVDSVHSFFVTGQSS